MRKGAGHSCGRKDLWGLLAAAQRGLKAGKEPVWRKVRAGGSLQVPWRTCVDPTPLGGGGADSPDSHGQALAQGQKARGADRAREHTGSGGSP